MKQILGTGRRGSDDKKVVSRAEAVLIVLASAAAAVVTTVLAISEIVRLFAGPEIRHALELDDDGMQRAVGVVRRGLVLKHQMRLG